MTVNKALLHDQYPSLKWDFFQEILYETGAV